MRIRKNAKISPVLYSLSSENNLLQTHSCELNQSPWDVIIFPPAPSDSYPYQVDGEASFSGNGSLGDSIGAIESVASMRTFSEDEDNFLYQEEEEERENEPIFCCKTIGEGNWECGREAKEGHSLCEFHLAHLKNYNNSLHPGSKKLAKPAKKFSRGVAEKQAKPAKVVESEIEVAATTASSSNSSRISIGTKNFEYLEDDEDETDESMDGNGMKRGRKRIKARSLKSLM